MSGIKACLAAGERLLGGLLRMPAEDLLEMTSMSGFDFIVVDCEHGPDSVIDLRRHIGLADAQGVAVVVRVGSNEPTLVLRALDQGAAGIIAPHIDTAEQAASLVDATHYPPLGHRGFATYTRAGRFGTADPAAHQARLTAETLVIGMIESPAGVRRAAEVIATPGLDGIMIGTADLRASSGPTDPEVSESVREVNRHLAEQGAIRMDIVGTAAAAQAAFDDGAQLVVYNLAHSLMAHLAELRTVR